MRGRRNGKAERRPGDLSLPHPLTTRLNLGRSPFSTRLRSEFLGIFSRLSNRRPRVQRRTALSVHLTTHVRPAVTLPDRRENNTWLACTRTESTIVAAVVDSIVYSRRSNRPPREKCSGINDVYTRIYRTVQKTRFDFDRFVIIFNPPGLYAMP